MIYIITKDGQVIPASECVVIVLDDDEAADIREGLVDDERFEVAKAQGAKTLLSVIP